MSELIQHLRHTLRKLLRAPLFSTVAVLTLAVAIGSNAAIFSVVNGVLLEPLPFKDPESLVGIWHTAPGLGFPEVNQSPALHFTYLDESRSFETVGMWDNGAVTVTQLAEPEEVTSMEVTYQILPMLGIQPVAGRAFDEQDDTPGSPGTVILSYGYWQRRFGGDPSAVGSTLTVDGTPRQILGVLPAGVRFLSYDPELYLPFQFDRSKVSLGNFSYQAIGRLQPGVTVAQANADVDRMLPMAAERYPGITLGMLEQARFAGLVRPLRQDVVGDVSKVLWVLLGTVGIVLLIACANVANLFLARAEGQQREMAVRAAMGASRGHITGQLLGESVVLGVVAGGLGLLLAYLGLRLLVALGPESLPRLDEVHMNGRVLLFTLLVSVGSGVLFGLFPALRFGASNLASTLKEGGRGRSAGKGQHLARNGLVVAQMALAVVLLTGSGLMIRSFQELSNVNPGFSDPEEVLTFRVSIPSAEIENPEVMARTHREILRRVKAIPGVAAASITSSVTMDGYDNNDAVESEARPVVGDQLPPIRRYKWIGEGTFTTLGNRIVAGRDLTWADVDQKAKVAVVTEDLARAEWGEPVAAAVGKRIRDFSGQDSAGPWYEVVGVSGEIRDDGIGRNPVPTVYWPQVEESATEGGVRTQRSMAYVVRVRSGDPKAILPAVREAVWAVNPNLPLARVRTLKEIASGSMAQTSFTLVMLAIAAAAALFLGAVGMYGVISYVVSLRTMEIGVRIAMGADGADVSRMVLGQAGGLAAVGVGLGLVAAAALTRLMASLLFGVSALDPLTFASVAVSLSAVALGASWIPAHRASQVDPLVALRME